MHACDTSPTRVPHQAKAGPWCTQLPTPFHATELIKITCKPPPCAQIRRLFLCLDERACASTFSHTAALACLAMLAPHLVSLQLFLPMKEFDTACAGLEACTQLTYLCLLVRRVLLGRCGRPVLRNRACSAGWHAMASLYGAHSSMPQPALSRPMPLAVLMPRLHVPNQCVQGEGGSVLTLSPEVGRLASLRHMELRVDNAECRLALVLRAGSIPPALSSLVFGYGVRWPRLPSALLEARSSLRRLELVEVWNDKDGAFYPKLLLLSALGALSYLHLKWASYHYDSRTPTALDPSITALSSLQALELSEPLLDRGGEDWLMPLEALPTLTALKINECIASCAVELPLLPRQLGYLFLAHCPVLWLEDLHPLAPNLQALALHIADLPYVASAEVSGLLTALRRLLLWGNFTGEAFCWPGEVGGIAEVAAAIQSLSRLPALELVSLDSSTGRVAGGATWLWVSSKGSMQRTEGCAPAFRALQAARPALRLVQHSCPHRHSRQQEWERPPPPACPWCLRG